LAHGRRSWRAAADAQPRPLRTRPALRQDSPAGHGDRGMDGGTAARATLAGAAAKRRNVGLIVLAQVLALALWFSGTAAGPGMMREVPAIGADYLALLTSAVQLGFVAGTLVSALFALPDRLDPRRLFAAA